MDPALIALLALIASAVQVGILRAIDYYFPRGHTAVDDRIAETAAQRGRRHKREANLQEKANQEIDDDYVIVDPEEIIE